MRLRLRELREARGLRVSDMVARLGVKDSRYRKWEAEAAAIPLEYAVACCSVLRCSLDELAGRVAPALSSDESELVDLFRRSNYQGREAILAVARASSGVEARRDAPRVTA